MVIRDSTHALTALTFNHYHPGFTLPVLECAAGLVHIANITAEERGDLIRALKLLPRRTNMHVVDLIENGTLIGDIRRDGYAARGFNQFTNNPGKTSSIAVPIVDADDRVRGALTLAFFATATRMSEAIAQFVAPLTATAAAIRTEL